PGRAAALCPARRPAPLARPANPAPPHGAYRRSRPGGPRADRPSRVIKANSRSAPSSRVTAIPAGKPRGSVINASVPVAAPSKPARSALLRTRRSPSSLRVASGNCARTASTRAAARPCATSRTLANQTASAAPAEPPGVDCDADGGLESGAGADFDLDRPPFARGRVEIGRFLPLPWPALPRRCAIARSYRESGRLFQVS